MTPSASRRLLALAVASLCAGAGGSQSAGQTASPQTPAAQAPSFREAVDVIPVDVQVVDGAGSPVAGLTADRFEVTISGKRRRVVSADLVDFRQTSAPGSPSSQTFIAGAPPPSPDAAAASNPASSIAGPPARAAALSLERRIYILAIDCASFDEGTARPVIRAAAEFIKRLRPQDEVGLFAFPIGPKVDPTTDHDAVTRALDTIMSRREMPPPGEFNLSPSNLIDLSSRSGLGEAAIIVEQLCGTDAGCVARLMAEVSGQLMIHEGAAASSIAMLRALVSELGKVPERKTVVLVSGGVLSSSSGFGLDAGKVAAHSNVNVYTLYIDQLWLRQMSAESRGRPNASWSGISTSIVPDPGRDSLIVSQWLDEFSQSGGGSFLRVTAGDGAPAFARVLNETSAYYLLGVEPTPQDRDGRPHELRVRVRDRRVNVRGRSWVVVPKPGTERRPAASLALAPSPPSEVSSSAPPPPAPALPPAPAAVRTLADAFDRDDPAPMFQALAPRGSNALIRAFRESESPWPASPRRTAAFALDLAIAGLRTDSPFTREEAMRLLGEYAVRVRQPTSDDVFECTWLWSAASQLQGLLISGISVVVTERATERCPAHSSLRLAHAVVKDQQLMLDGVPAVMLRGRGEPAPPAEVAGSAITETERQVLALYDAAATHPETRYEARLRAAWLHFRGGRHADGLALVESAQAPPDDPQLKYLGALIRGQLLRAAGRFDEAVEAFRLAIAEWPSASAARTALMTLLVNRGDTAGAAALANEVLTSGSTNTDPWWVYYLGDYRAHFLIRAKLRELLP